VAYLRLPFVAALLCSVAVWGCEGGSSGGDGGTDADDSEQLTDGDEGGDGGTGGPGGMDAGDGADGGSDGNPGGGGGGGGANPSLDAVEAACEADCEAQFATECPPVSQNVLVCKLQCASITVQLDDFCLGEYTSLVECRASGGYDCINGYPTPRSTCALDSMAYSECTIDLGCKRNCADAIEDGCEGASFDGCFDACVAEKAALPGYCGTYFDSLLLCESQLGIVCETPDPVSAASCTYQASNIGDCIADETDDLCEGYCFVTEHIGCGGGSDCIADCNARLADTTCGSAYSQLVDCELRHGDFQCIDGELAGVDICDSDNSQYEMCVNGM